MAFVIKVIMHLKVKKWFFKISLLVIQWYDEDEFPTFY